MLHVCEAVCRPQPADAEHQPLGPGGGHVVALAPPPAPITASGVRLGPPSIWPGLVVGGGAGGDGDVCAAAAGWVPPPLPPVRGHVCRVCPPSAPPAAPTPHRWLKQPP